ncbi:MAG: MBL fold metallo-hydrolase [Planctomycetota bacterium]|jgi:phosphoribosyl 1,2-cyclic phosphodiesterase
MDVVMWGTRGSLAAPGPDTVHHGGNTSCVEVRAEDDGVLVLDAGTGIRGLGASLEPLPRRIDLLLTHYHMDHIQGLGFFAPLLRAEANVGIWGPGRDSRELRARLESYLSPPLFPVRLEDLSTSVELHEIPDEPFEIQGCRVSAGLVSHPGPTLGYRIEHAGASLA